MLCQLCGGTACRRCSAQGQLPLCPQYAAHPAVERLVPITPLSCFFPCMQCERASLIATQLNGNKVHLLAAMYANAKNQVRVAG
jgi:hypothetical protein